MPFEYSGACVGDYFGNEEEDCGGDASAQHTVVERSRLEAQVLWPLEQLIVHCSFLSILLESGGEGITVDQDRHPLGAISCLLSFSHDEEMRQIMCQLGALQTIASLFHLDHAVHGSRPRDQCCNSLRRYALMALTNLTLGDGNNKALLCANKEFMEALVAQLDLAPDDLLQATGSVLRNLSWHSDNKMKAVLNEIGTVTALVKAAMRNKNETTLETILSALWILSAHSSTNKAEFCAVEGALAFLVDMLTHEGHSKTLTIIEIVGGILCNVSSQVALREDYRIILRQRNCLGILLQQLKSESLEVVSYACGTLWVLSACSPEDQRYLWDIGAVPRLRSLTHSKHEMIAEGSRAALENLLNFRPGSPKQSTFHPIAKPRGLKGLPTLNAQKQRTLEHELSSNLAESCDNPDAITQSKEKYFPTTMEADSHVNSTRLTRSAIVSKSESRVSNISAKSDSINNKYRRGHSTPLDHGHLKKGLKSQSFNLCTNSTVPSEFEADQETELLIEDSGKYKSEVVGNIQPPAGPASHRKRRRRNKFRNFTTFVNKVISEVVEEKTLPEVISGQQCSGSAVPIVTITATKPIAVPSTTLPIKSAQETPLMGSRRSSMDSLASAELNTADDVSSVARDLRRLVRGSTSPPKLPDSPTLSVPQSQRRIRNINPSGPGIQQYSSTQRLAAQQRLLSVFHVFEDDVDTFRVEDTPAQFLCATSLSNLSLDDEPDEPKIESNSVAKELVLDLEAECVVKADEVQMEIINIENCAPTDGKEEPEDTMLLTTCINIEMNHGASSSKLLQTNSTDSISTPKKKDVKATDYEDIVWQYFSKDAPHIKKRRKKKFSLRIDRPDNYNDRTNARLPVCARDSGRRQSVRRGSRPLAENRGDRSVLLCRPGNTVIATC